MRNLFLPILGAIVLLGCTGGAGSYRHGGEEAKQAAISLRTSDPVELRRRWGDMADLVGQRWVGWDGAGLNKLELNWVVTGSVMHYKLDIDHQNYTYSEYRMVQYNPEKNRLDFYRFFSDSGAEDVAYTGFVHESGLVLIQGHSAIGAPTRTLAFDRHDNALTHGRSTSAFGLGLQKIGEISKMRPMTVKQYQAALQQIEQGRAQAAQAKAEEDREFRRNVAIGMQGFAAALGKENSLSGSQNTLQPIAPRLPQTSNLVAQRQPENIPSRSQNTQPSAMPRPEQQANLLAQRPQEERQRSEKAAARVAAEKAAAEKAAAEKTAAEERKTRHEADRKAEAEARAQAERDYLQRLAAGTRMEAKNCYGEQHVMGALPSIKPRAVSCIDMHFRAYCPGTPLGAAYQGVLRNMVSMGASCFGDTVQIKPKLSCKAEDIRVEVTQARPCS